MTIRVLVADDSEAFREGFVLLLRSRSGYEVVAEAADGREAISRAALHQPDVVVMDLNMPQVGGIDATRAITAASPHIRVLVLTMHDDDASVLTAMRAGASGYVVKGAPQDELVRAITAVAAGEVIFGPAVARQVLARLTTDAAPAAQPFPELTAREHEILVLLASGSSNAAIASALSISAKTVRNHTSNIFTKLRVSDRTQAVVKAREAGLGDT